MSLQHSFNHQFLCNILQSVAYRTLPIHVKEISVVYVPVLNAMQEVF